jgi:hypothetical protein
MPAIRPVEEISDKWQRRASVAGIDYQRGIQFPRRSWEEGALKAENAYKAGVTAAATQGRFGGGIRRAGNKRWVDGAIRKGVGRYPEGVAVAKDDWSKGFKPYADTITATALPDPGPRGTPTNMQRSTMMAMALRAKKEALLGAK